MNIYEHKQQIFAFLIVPYLNRFALRGNVIDLAIDMIIGTVFINIVQVLADDIVTRPLGLVLGDVDFANLTIKMENLFKQ